MEGSKLKRGNQKEIRGGDRGGNEPSTSATDARTWGESAGQVLTIVSSSIRQTLLAVIRQCQGKGIRVEEVVWVLRLRQLRLLKIDREGQREGWLPRVFRERERADQRRRESEQRRLGFFRRRNLGFGGEREIGEREREKGGRRPKLWFRLFFSFYTFSFFFSYIFMHFVFFFFSFLSFCLPLLLYQIAKCNDKEKCFKIPTFIRLEIKFSSFPSFFYLRFSPSQFQKLRSDPKIPRFCNQILNFQNMPVGSFNHYNTNQFLNHYKLRIDL